MKNKIVKSALITLIILALISLIIFTVLHIFGIEINPPHEVEIVVINPIMGEEMNLGTTIRYHSGEVPDGAKIEIKIRDKNTQKFLTDKNLGYGKSLDLSYTMEIRLNTGNHTLLNDNRFWPTEQGKYLIHVTFNNGKQKYTNKYGTDFGYLGIEIVE